jgi:ankyrin repeat protein
LKDAQQTAPDDQSIVSSSIILPFVPPPEEPQSQASIPREERIENSSHELQERSATRPETPVDSNPQSTPELEKLLRLAIANGNEGLVKTLLDRGADIECIEETGGMRPLQLATSQGKSKITELLLMRGAQVAPICEIGNNALHSAATVGDVGSISLLVKHGIYIDSTGANDLTPLHFAVKIEHVTAIRQLLALGANVEAKSTGERGYHPLHFTVELGNDTVTKTLLEDGKADVEAANFRRRPASSHFSHLQPAVHSKDHPGCWS